MFGAPREVGGRFNCARNELITLRDASQKVGGDFWCSDNKLKTLAGLPVLNDENKIHCDYSLVKRYNLGIFAIKYKDLVASQTYQNDVKIEKLRHLDREGRQEAQVKRNAGFAAFKKLKAEERE